MAADPVERMNYFQFQQIGAEDFRVQQAYHRDQLRRHSLGAHSWGVVSGCRIVQTPQAGTPEFCDIHVTPGLAVDGFGREIVLLEPVRVAPEMFGGFDGDRVIELWLRYDEYTSRTGNDRLAICALDGAYSRVVEGYRLLVGPQTPEHDPLIVGGDEAKLALTDGTADGGAPIAPADTSIAAQDFPDSDKASWPVRLGSVRWDGDVGKFRVVASPDVLVQNRRYAGLIGASLLAEGQRLRIAPRDAVADPDVADFAGVEGRLTVGGRIVAQRDILLRGGKLSFQGAGGAEAGGPLWIQRLSTRTSASDLRIHLGDTPGSADARLTIGAGTAPHGIADEAIVLAVRADDKVDIPAGQLRFPGTARAAIEFAPPTDGSPAAKAIGWQGGSVYHRATSGFYWFDGGVHTPGEGAPGTGGTLAMRLSDSGSLYFGNGYRQVVNFAFSGGGGGAESFGIGAQANTLYARSPQNFAWYRGGGHDSASLSPGGGARAMSLDSASVLTVEGGLRSRGRVELWGSALDFRDSGGGTNTDVLEITRVNRGSNASDLQVTIGDDLSADDRFVVGPRVGGSLNEQFVVHNSGDARVARDLYVRGRNVMMDVVTGEHPLGAVGAGSGTVPLVVTSSRLSSISGAEIMVALSDIRNVSTAVDARWRVSYTHGSRSLLLNGASFPIHWLIEDVDGQILSFSYIAIFYA